MCQALKTLLPGQELPDVAVTLVADRWISDTTSDGAAGLWEVNGTPSVADAYYYMIPDDAPRHAMPCMDFAGPMTCDGIAAQPYKLDETPAERVNTWGEATYKYLEVPIQSIHMIAQSLTHANPTSENSADASLCCRTCTSLGMRLQQVSQPWQRISCGQRLVRTRSGEMLSRTSATSHRRSCGPLTRQASPDANPQPGLPQVMQANLLCSACMMTPGHLASRRLQVRAGMVFHHHHLRAAAVPVLAAGQGPAGWRHPPAAQHHISSCRL